MLFLFCETLTTFVERIFLSHCSMEAVHASANATYLANMFQMPCMAVAMMAQVFVGLYQGQNEPARIGPCVWQMIWFSLLSLALTLPLSYGVSWFYFKDTVIQQAGTEYFSFLALWNFLFPLKIACSAFYLGRGKTSLVTAVMLGSYALNLGLSWVLILGVDGIIPSLGITGAAFAKCFSLGVCCTVFLGLFLSKNNRILYRTDRWQLSLSDLWVYVYPGLVRAFAYFSSTACWVATCYFMTKKGGEYLNVVTIGSIVFGLLAFTTQGLYRAILTIASNLFGAGKYGEIWQLCRSFMLYIALISIALAFPILFFPNSLMGFFDASLHDVFKGTFKTIHHWVWLYMIALTVQMSLCAIIVAARDLRFQLYAYLSIWFITFLPAYWVIEMQGRPADDLWIIATLGNVILAVVFLGRILQRRGKETPAIP